MSIRVISSVFVYVPLDEKIGRLKSIGKPEKESLHLIEEVDHDRAAFIRHYFGHEWPARSLYSLMINSRFGDEYTAEAPGLASGNAAGRTPV